MISYHKLKQKNKAPYTLYNLSFYIYYNITEGVRHWTVLVQTYSQVYIACGMPSLYHACFSTLCTAALHLLETMPVLLLNHTTAYMPYRFSVFALADHKGENHATRPPPLTAADL